MVDFVGDLAVGALVFPLFGGFGCSRGVFGLAEEGGGAVRFQKRGSEF